MSVAAVPARNQTEAQSPEADRLPGWPHPRETRRLFGHGTAEATLLEAWREGRLHHAWLLCGPRGVGKATLAYRFARALIAHGDDPPAMLELPEEHPVARRVAAGSEPRLAVLRREVNPRTGRLRAQIVVDDVRRLRSFLGLTAPDGGWRAVIVDAADEMNAAAANALLKTLEEPPPRVVMLLVTHAPGALLPTIRSRCRRLDLRPLGAADLAAALAELDAAAEAADVAALAELAQGAVGEALALVGAGGLPLYRRMVEALGAPGGIDRAVMVELAEAAAGRGGGVGLELFGRLLLALLGRLARHGAGLAPATEAAPGEAALMARVAADRARARDWAEAAARIAGTLRHAQAVNLDPAQTILDIFLDLDGVLAHGRGATRGRS